MGKCECSDTRCPVHPGEFCKDVAVETLYRRDMDNAPVQFCAACAEDAWTSGVFSEIKA